MQNKGLHFIGNIFRHFHTITTHRHMVIRNCFYAGIFWQGLFHDLSKYGPSEFLIGVKYYQGFRSPNEGERDAYGYSKAWMHHKGRNKHHFEYWTDYDRKTKQLAPVPMPTKYVIEMFCDRVAASKVYLKKAYTDASPLEYYNGRKDHRDIHPKTAKQLEALLHMLAEQGEKKTFAYIRSLKK
ncbi:MAG: catalase [Lachnospiraceae bacterium]|nr:catalase [Lachnospiraceae bacterium]